MLCGSSTQQRNRSLAVVAAAGLGDRLECWDQRGRSVPLRRYGYYNIRARCVREAEGPPVFLGAYWDGFNLVSATHAELVAGQRGENLLPLARHF